MPRSGGLNPDHAAGCCWIIEFYVKVKYSSFAGLFFFFVQFIKIFFIHGLDHGEYAHGIDKTKIHKNR